MMKGCVKQALLACTTSNLLYQFQVRLCLQTWMHMQRSCSILIRTLETIFLGQATRSLLRSCKPSVHRQVPHLVSCLGSWPGNCVACICAPCIYAVTLACRGLESLMHIPKEELV